MPEEGFPNLSETDAERHVAAITGESVPIPPPAEHSSPLRQGFTTLRNLGKIAVKGDLPELLVTALRRSF